MKIKNNTISITSVIIFNVFLLSVSLIGAYYAHTQVWLHNSWVACMAGMAIFFYGYCLVSAMLIAIDAHQKFERPSVIIMLFTAVMISSPLYIVLIAATIF